jgi:hypothetical protein
MRTSSKMPAAPVRVTTIVSVLSTVAAVDVHGTMADPAAELSRRIVGASPDQLTVSVFEPAS